MFFKKFLRRVISRQTIEALQALQSFLLIPLSVVRVYVSLKRLPVKKNTRSYPSLRIAVVKQDVYTNLYCAPQSASVKELLLSSLKHSGPIGLFTQFDASFFILKEAESEECLVWREKIDYCKHGTESDFYKLRDEIFMDGEFGHAFSQATLALDVDDVDWGNFDIVVSIDVAVPAKITDRFPRTLWCYYISEPCMPSYHSSKAEIIKGYDVFLNQRFEPSLLRQLPHWELNFPFALQYANCIDEVLSPSLWEPVTERAGIFLEYHTALLLTPAQRQALERFGPVREASGSTKSVLENLVRSKYFLKIRGRRVWGNAMAEAISAGCLALGQPGEYKNISLFTPGTFVFSFEQAVSKIANFERDQVNFTKELHSQRKLLNWYCFDSPIASLLSRLSEKTAIQ